MSLDLQLKLIFYFFLYGCFIHVTYNIFLFIIKEFFKNMIILFSSEIIFFIGQIYVYHLLVTKISGGLVSIYLFLFIVIGNLISYLCLDKKLNSYLFDIKRIILLLPKEELKPIIWFKKKKKIRLSKLAKKES